MEVQGFPCSSAGKESACNMGDLGSIPGWEDPLEKEMATHSSIGVDNSMDGRVHRVAKSQIQLSYFHFHFTLKGLGLSVFLAGGSGSIPGQGTKINLVRKNCICIYKCTYIWDFLGGSMVKTPLANAGDMDSIPGLRRSPRERRKWQPTPVFLPWKSHGQSSLVGYCP